MNRKDAGRYFSRLQTLETMRQLTHYADGYNLYLMDILYDYSLDALLDYGITDDETMVDAILSQALPGLPVRIQPPQFGCSAFCTTDIDGEILMGRNYDFRRDTSCMLVHCAPVEGYASVGFAALDNVNANDPMQTMEKRLAALTAPFICLDGMNEKGLSVAVLTLDSAPVFQQTGKPVITPTLAIRLVLDRAANVDEAVKLLQGYDMFASGGRDYHFYLADASGQGCVVEYDCDRADRPLVATSVRTATNFYALYSDRVLPDQRNGIYGHGRERYDRIERILEENAGTISDGTAWQALRAASQLPDPTDVTSNTQWSVLYNDTKLTAQIVFRRHWEDVIQYDLKYGTITT